MNRLDDLTHEELKKVIELNPKFVDRCRDYCTDIYGPAYCWVDEYLHNAPDGVDYSISGCCDYLTFSGANFCDLLTWFKQLQHDYEFIYPQDEANAYISILERYSDILDNADLGYISVKAKDYDYMNGKCDEAAEYFRAAILERLSSEYTYFTDSPENCIEYCNEMEYNDNILISADYRVVDLEEIKAVFENNGIRWDVNSIKYLIEEVFDTVNQD